jgi:hypothetical protein
LLAGSYLHARDLRFVPHLLKHALYHFLPA